MNAVSINKTIRANVKSVIDKVNTHDCGHANVTVRRILLERKNYGMTQLTDTFLK